VLPTLQDEDKSWQKQKKTDQKCLTMITMAAQSISLILLVTTLNISISQALPRGSQKSIFGSTEGYDDPYFDRPVYKTSGDFTLHDVPLWGWIIIGVLIMLVITLCFGVATLELIALWKRRRENS